VYACALYACAVRASVDAFVVVSAMR